MISGEKSDNSEGNKSEVMMVEDDPSAYPASLGMASASDVCPEARSKAAPV